MSGKDSAKASAQMKGRASSTPSTKGPKPKVTKKAIRGDAKGGSRGVATPQNQKPCRKCKQPTRLFKGYIICASNPDHNLKVESVSCGNCKTKANLVRYPGKVFCPGCGFTTVCKEVARTVKTAPPKAPKPKSLTKPKDTKATPKGPEAKVKAKVDKAPKQPKVASKGEQPKVEKSSKSLWHDKDFMTLQGRTVESFLTYDMTASKAKLLAIRDSRCYSCGSIVCTTTPWKKMPVNLEGYTAKGFTCTRVCLLPRCMQDNDITLVVARKNKKQVSEPVPKGKPIITPQVPLPRAERPTDVSEEQVREMFNHEVDRHEIRDLIKSALAEANAYFREADPKNLKKDLATANKALAELRRKMPVALNVRWNKGQIRTVPMRWTVPRRTVLNPLWSVYLSMLAESDTLSTEDIHCLKDVAWISVLLESQIMTKTQKKQKIRKVLAEVHSQPAVPKDETSEEASQLQPSLPPKPQRQSKSSRAQDLLLLDQIEVDET